MKYLKIIGWLILLFIVGTVIFKLFIYGIYILFGLIFVGGFWSGYQIAKLRFQVKWKV